MKQSLKGIKEGLRIIFAHPGVKKLLKMILINT